MVSKLEGCGAGIVVAAALALAPTAASADDRTLALSVGDELETFGVELLEGADPIRTDQGRYCVRLPAGATLNYFSSVAHPTGAPPPKPAANSGSASAGASASTAGDTVSAAATPGPDGWMHLQASAAAVFWVDAEGIPVEPYWEARPARLFVRSAAGGRIEACAARPGVPPPGG